MGLSSEQRKGVLPPISQLETTFVPAEVMTPANRILPEKIHYSNGQPIAVCQTEVPGRITLAEVTPQPVLPELDADPAAISAASEFSPGARPVARRGSNHVFVDLSVPMAVSTQWKTISTPGAHPPTGEQPILPAPSDTMEHTGKAYQVISVKTGQVLAGVESIPPRSSPNSMESPSMRF